MQNVRLFHTGDITQAVLAVPTGHRHLRLALHTAEGEILIFPEAVVAAIVRAYVTLKTHPLRTAILLAARQPETVKDGYASTQLLETADDESELQTRLATWLTRAETPSPEHPPRT